MAFPARSLNKNVGVLHFTVYDSCEDLAAEGPKVPVLLLHGWLGSSRDFHALALALSDRGHDVLVPDLPFHAASHHVEADTPLHAARVVFRATSLLLNPVGDSDKTAVPGVFVVGYSLGGRIALEGACDAALQDVLDVQALVLVSSGLPPDAEHARASKSRQHAALSATVLALNSRQAVAHWLSQRWYTAPMWGGLSEEPGFADLLQQRLSALLGSSHGEEEGAALSAEGVSRLRAVARAAEHLAPSRMSPTFSLPETCGGHIPVLYVYGERDVKYDGVAREFCSAVAPQVVVARISNAGHNVFAQGYAEASSSVLGFVADNTRGSSWRFRPAEAFVLRYSIPLKRPMSVGDCEVSIREGFLLTLRDEGGISGVGDVAPLPGLHPESVNACYKSLQRWWTIHATRAGRSKQYYTANDLFKRPMKDSFDLPTAVSSALCAAIAQGIARVRKVSTASFLSMMSNPSSVPENAVSYNSVAPRPSKPTTSRTRDENCANSVESRMEDIVSLRGLSRVFKLKVGYAGSVDFDANIVRSFADQLRWTGALLRADANCSWSVSDFRRFASLTKSCLDTIEYIEEPFRTESPEFLIRTLSDLYGLNEPRSMRLPEIASVGLDESLAQFDLPSTLSMLRAPGVAAVVLKPSIQGWLYRVYSLAGEARKQNLKVILSSVFDSGVGLAWITLLAASLGYPAGAAHGLGTFDALAEDVIHPGFENSCVNRKSFSTSLEESEAFLCKAAEVVMGAGVSLLPLSESPNLQP